MRDIFDVFTSYRSLLSIDWPTKCIPSMTVRGDRYRCTGKHMDSLDCLLLNCSIPFLVSECFLQNIRAFEDHVNDIMTHHHRRKRQTLSTRRWISSSSSFFFFLHFSSLSVPYVVLPHCHLNIFALTNRSLQLTCHLTQCFHHHSQMIHWRTETLCSPLVHVSSLHVLLDLLVLVLSRVVVGCAAQQQQLVRPASSEQL